LRASDRKPDQIPKIALSGPECGSCQRHCPCSRLTNERA
jgi:hypothetical protein